MPTPAPAQKPCLECQLNGVVRVEEVEEVEGLATHHQAHRVLLVAPLVLLQAEFMYILGGLNKMKSFMNSKFSACRVFSKVKGRCFATSHKKILSFKLPAIF